MENRRVHVPMILKEETDNTFSGEESDNTFPEDPSINDGRKRHLPIQEFIFEDNKDNNSLQILEKSNSDTLEDVTTNINKELGQIRKVHLPIIFKSEDDTVESTDSTNDKNLSTQEYYFIKEEQINDTETSFENLVQKNSTCNIKEPLLDSNCSSSKKDLFQNLETNVEIKKEDAVEITLQDITETNQNFQIFLNNIPNHENEALIDTNSLTNNCSAKTTNHNKNTEQNIPLSTLTYINDKNTESQEEKLKIDKDPKLYVYNKNTVIEEEKEKKENLLETDIKIDEEKVDEILHTSVDIKEQEPQDFPQESEIFDLTKDDNNKILQTVNHSAISTQLTQKSNITQPLNIHRLSKVIKNSLCTTKEGDISTTETVDLTENISENTNSRLPTEFLNSITKTIEGIIQSNDDILSGAHKVRKKAVKHPSTSKKCKNLKPISTQYYWTPKRFVPINLDSQGLALNIAKTTTITNKATNINENLISVQENQMEKNNLMDVSDTIDLTKPKQSSLQPSVFSNDYKRTAKNGAENKIQNVRMCEIVSNYVPKNTITVQAPQNTLVENNVEDNTMRRITRSSVAKNNTKPQINIPKEVPSPKNKTLTENCQLNATRSPKQKLFSTPSGSVYEIGPNICKIIKFVNQSQTSIANIIKETGITNETTNINQNSELYKMLTNTSEGPKKLIENDVIDLTEVSQGINDNTSAEVPKKVTSSKNEISSEIFQLNSTKSLKGKVFYTPNRSAYEIEPNVCNKNKLDSQKLITDFIKKNEVVTESNVNQNLVSIQKNQMVKNKELDIGGDSKRNTQIISGNEKLSLQTIPDSQTSIVFNHGSHDAITVPQAFPNGSNTLQNKVVVNNGVTINTTSDANENSSLNTGENKILTTIVQPVSSNTQNNTKQNVGNQNHSPQNELDTHIKNQINKNVISPLLKSNNNNNASHFKPPPVLSNQPVEIFEITENIPGASLEYFQDGTSSDGQEIVSSQSFQDTLNCLSNSEKNREIEANDSQKIILHENEAVILEREEEVPPVTDGNANISKTESKPKSQQIDTLETSSNVQKSKMLEFRTLKHVRKLRIKLKPGEEFKVNDRIYVRTNNGFVPKKKKLPIKKLKKVDLGIVNKYREEIDAKTKEIIEEKKKKLMKIISLSCDKCDFKTLKGKKDLILHSVVHRPKAKLYECKLCPFKGTCQSYFKKHMNSHLGKNKENIKKMKCGKCSYSTSDTSNLNKHQRVHMTDKEKQALPDLKCDLCDFVCKFQDILRPHMKQKHKKLGGVKTHKCEECLFFTRFKNKLEVHMVDVHGKEFPDAEILHCDQCFFSTIFKFELRRHIQAHNQKKQRKEKPQDEPVKCNHCSYSTMFKRRLISHMKIHAEKIFKCIYCEFKAGAAGALKVHLLRHIDKDSSLGLQCYHCEYKTTVKHQLAGHIKVHQRKQE